MNQLLERIARRALYYSTQMIHLANHRPDAEKGDPKVGGHPAACASSTHILGTLHLVARQPQDTLAVKPHASPMDHAYSHLLGLFRHRDGTLFNEEESKKVMTRLRAFLDPADPSHEPAFQSYHAASDPDSFHYFPTGSVGIPPVASAYTALAYRFAEKQGFKVPANAHFWSIIGDSEFREGSLAECMPDVAERGLGSVTWIIDYNRQNLDGTRIVNEEGIRGTDAERIERMAKANGWRVIQVRHGGIRQAFFAKAGNDALRAAIENLSDFELQALLLKQNGKVTRARFIELAPALRNRLLRLTDSEILDLLEDLGGHDIEALAHAFAAARASKKPTLVIAHTIKGWGLECQAMTGNHSMLASERELGALRQREKVPESDPFQRFAPTGREGRFCQERGAVLNAGIDSIRRLRQENQASMRARIEQAGGFPGQFGINLKLAPWGNTQWMWGQLAAKLIRIAGAASAPDAPLSDEEKRWIPAAHHVVTMAPDVGTSTNLNPSMDGKIFGPDTVTDFESIYEVKDTRRPDLVPLEKEANRHLRFEIEEANAMTCAGAFGKMASNVGVPFLPLMTIYDFFIKRALDQFFYNLYWQSGFILVGTPSGVTLSPEGAQHSWKSDFQIPNCVTWEPAFCLEMDWIVAEAVRRHFLGENTGREGVLIRAVTRGLEQKHMLERLKGQARFAIATEEQVLEATRADVLEGGYWLIHHEGREGYSPGDNVVHIFAMGALASEAIRASDLLLSQGVFANVALVTSTDLLIGTLGRETGYRHLRQTMRVNANLYLNPRDSIAVGQLDLAGSGGVGGRLALTTRADLLSLRGSRVPVVAVCDGEPGLLDNIGSIVGVPQDTLAVRKHSKSGRPADVYAYHHLDPASIAQAAVALLEQAASEELVVSRAALAAETESTPADQETAEQPPGTDEDGGTSFVRH